MSGASRQQEVIEAVRQWQTRLLQLDRRNALLYFAMGKRGVALRGGEPHVLLEKLAASRSGLSVSPPVFVVPPVVAASSHRTLDGPDDPTRRRRLEWSVLLKRVFSVDVFTCPRCAGPMRLIAVIEDAAVAEKILAHVGLPTRAPPRGRPWRPGQQFLPDHARTSMDGVDIIDPPAFAE